MTQVKKVVYDGKTYTVEFNEYAPLGAEVYEHFPDGGYVLRSPHGLDIYFNEAGLPYFKNNSILYGQAAEDRVNMLLEIIKKAKGELS